MIEKYAPEIIFTGGPCGGKSTTIEWLRAELENRGYHVLISCEVATDFINGGIPLGKSGYPQSYFQKEVMLECMARRQRMQQFARLLKPHKPVILYDRGPMDSRAYMDPLEFDAMRQDMGLSIFDLSWSYDAVIHMRSAASYSEDKYLELKGSNIARYSTYRQALLDDENLIKTYVDHHHLRVVPFGSVSRTKALRHVLHALGDQEIERKYLVENAFVPGSRVQAIARIVIEQHYRSPKSRITKATKNGEWSYISTDKDGLGISRTENDEWMTAVQFAQLKHSLFGGRSTRSLYKTRQRFIWNDRVYELDYFDTCTLPSGYDQPAILEVELTREDEYFEVPPFIEVIKEVTNDEDFSSYNLATPHARQ